MAPSKSLLIAIKKPLDDIVNKVDYIVKKYDSYINKITSACHLGKISLALGLYGIVILFLSGLENINYCIYNFIVITDILFVFFLIICIIAEYDLFQFEINHEETKFVNRFIKKPYQ